jgi:hypothetical protein
MYKIYVPFLAFNVSACSHEANAGSSAEPVCHDTIVSTCEDDEITGQMVFHIEVPDWNDGYESVSASLHRLDGPSLEGEFHPVDKPCGTLWEIEFRLFNITCDSITTKEITSVTLIK